MEYPSIFSPLTVKSMTVKNRIAMLPMGSNMGGEFGNITDDHIRYYEQRAKGGTGLIIVENACVYKQGLNGTTQIRIDKDRYIPGFSRLVERIHSYGACASLQINHAAASPKHLTACMISSLVIGRGMGPPALLGSQEALRLSMPVRSGMAPAPAWFI